MPGGSRASSRCRRRPRAVCRGRSGAGARPARRRANRGPAAVTIALATHLLAALPHVDAAELAFAAGAALAIAVIDLAGAVRPRMPLVRGRMRAAADVFARAGREGRNPGAAERRRLLAGVSVAAFAIGGFVFGAIGGVIAAAAAPVVARRALRARRARYCR